MTDRNSTDREALALFERMLDIPAEDRDEFLAQHCGSDAVRRRVLAMLKADSGAGGLLEQDADRRLAELSVDRPAESRPAPARIGPYRVVERIGQGGMATVYRAERADQDFEQTVALKLILPSRRSEHWESRFLQERQILASLQHPNIAALLDGGLSDGGEPYFAMEFVDGLPITGYCDEHRLTIDRRIRLFLSVCDAVGYAHGKLIVHRDLKPSNILVDDSGLPKLLDFGIAKLLSDDRGDRTETTLRALTPDYAAPEQFAGGQVTTAVDIYALGGLLFELLSGSRPFADTRGSALDMERRIRETGAPTFSRLFSTLEPAERERAAAARGLAPGRLRRAIGGDLENIALKALRAEPERRYSTAESLAADLRRYLDGLPVQARADTAWYRLKKFATRHPIGVPLGALAVIGLLFSTGIALHQADQAETAAARARLQAARANETRDFVTSLFEFAAPDKALGERLTARQLLDLGANRVNEQLAGQPGLRAEMLLLLANTYAQLGLYDTALPLAQQASELQASLNDTGLQADTLLVRARLQRLKGEFEQAITLLDRAAGLAGNADDARRSALLVERGEVHREQAQFDLAEVAFNEALALDQARLAPTADIARDLYRLGTLKFSAGDSELALTLLREAASRLAEGGAANTTRHASIQHDIGVMLIQRGELNRAQRILEDVRDARTTLLGEQHPDLATTLKELAGIARQQGASEEAERLYLQALAINETMLGSEHPETSNNLNSLAVFYRGLGDDERALDYAQRALAGATRAYGPRHPTVGLMTVNVASMQRMLGDLAAARQSVTAGLDIIVGALGEEHHLAGVAYNALAGIQQDQGENAAAEANYRRALAVFEATAGANHPHTVSILNGLASVLMQNGQIDEAEQHYRRAVETATAALPADHPNLAIVQLGLARVAASRGRCGEATALGTTYLPVLQAARQHERPDVRAAAETIRACN
ncbi:MAG: serine/threonine-protein kinase [Pseudomonadota bacterium]